MQQGTQGAEASRSLNSLWWLKAKTGVPRWAEGPLTTQQTESFPAVITLALQAASSGVIVPVHFLFVCLLSHCCCLFTCPFCNYYLYISTVFSSKFKPGKILITERKDKRVHFYNFTRHRGITPHTPCRVGVPIFSLFIMSAWSLTGNEFVKMYDKNARIAAGILRAWGR